MTRCRLQNFQKLYRNVCSTLESRNRLRSLLLPGSLKREATGSRHLCTFFQRAFDQMFQEICLQGLPVTFVLCNSGLVGPDGSTHHSPYSFSYLRPLPAFHSWRLFPTELRRLLAQSLDASSPTVILFPKDAGRKTWND